MALQRYSEADVILSERRRLEMPLLVTIWLGVLAFCLAEGSIFHLLAGTCAVAVNAWAAHRRQEVYVERSLVNKAVLIATIILGIELLSDRYELLVVPVGHFLILIQLCKLFEHKRNRDYVQLLALTAVLGVAGAILSTSPWFALAAVAHMGGVCYTTMVFTLKRGLDAVGAAQLESESAALSPRLVARNAISDWPGGALRRRLGVVLAGMLVTGAVMFLVTPRVRSQAAVGADRRRGVTGSFPRRLRLGSPRRIYLSDAVVMRVEATTPDGAEPPRYFRGRTFDVYAESSWRRSRRGPAWPAGPPPAPAVVQDVEMDASLLPTLFAVPTAVQCEVRDGRVYFGADGNVGLVDRDATRRWVRYRVRSLRPRDARSTAYLRRRTRTPAPGEPADLDTDITPRVRELAQRWAGDLARRRDALPPGPDRDRLDLDIARAVADKLADRCAYTLDLRDADPDRDAVEDFLFHMRKGHCEYFASAQTVLCRALGVHARLAAGFRSDATTDGAHLVRGRDAHAWTEVYTPSTYWRVVDPSPRRYAEPDRPWHAPLTQFWSDVRQWWRQAVVGYDNDARRRIGRWLAGVFGAVGRTVADAAGAAGRGVFNLLVHGYIDRGLQYAAFAVSGLGTVLLGVVLGRIARRELRYRRLIRRGLALPWQKMRFFARLVRLLERHGIERRDARTPRELAEEAVRKLALPPGALDELIDLYYRLRWGEQQVSLARVRAAERQVADLAERLKQRKS